MSNCVEISIISSLEGKRGSNPKVESIFPRNKTFKDDLLKVSLPFGASPGEFFINEIEKSKIISYIFEIEREGDRNDLASISFSLISTTITKNLKQVIQELINHLKTHNLLNIETFNQNLSKIVEGLNKESKIKIEKMVFDVGYFIKDKKLKLKLNRKKRGGLL